MAEYYPLLARAVAAQPNADPETRRGIYDRARKALLAQLRSHEPPIADDDIEREKRALEEAIARIENERGAARAAEKVEQKPTATQATAAANATNGSDRRGSVEHSSQPRPPVQRRPLQRPSLATGETLSKSSAERERRPREAPSFAPTPIVAAQSQAMENIEAPAIESERRSPKEPHQSIPRSGMLRKFGRPRAGVADTGLIPVPAAEDADERLDPPVEDAIELGETPPAAPDAIHEARGDALRPSAPVAAEAKNRKALAWTLGAVAALLVIGVAVAAFIFRESPRTLAAHSEARRAAAQIPPAKMVARIGHPAPVAAPATGSPAHPPAAQPKVAAPATPSPAGAPAAQNPPASPAVPVAQRAAILVQSPTANNPKAIATYVGSVIWRLDTVSPGPGLPVELAIRAQINVPDAKFKASMLLEKNADATLPASHTIELRFSPGPGSPIGDIRQIDTPQMRKEGAPAGDPLSGIPAPITTNYFLIGLTKGGQEQARNVQLLRNRAWFDIPLLLANGKIAKITFEKGVEGTKAVSEALDSWSK